MRNIIKHLTRRLVTYAIDNNSSKVSKAELDLMLTMDVEEADFFNARIQFGSCNIMHVDDFYGDNTIDIRSEHLTRGSGLIGTEEVYNSDSKFVSIAHIVENEYKPRLNGPIFHYVKNNGNIKDMKHYYI